MEPLTKAEKKEIANRFLSDQAARNPEQYATYFEYYETVSKEARDGTQAYTPERAYLSHIEQVSAFNKLISNVLQTKAEFIRFLAANDVGLKQRDPAIRDLLRVSLLIDCDKWVSFPGSRKLSDYVPRTWKENQSFADCVERRFLSVSNTQKIREESESALAQRARLNAWGLKQWYKIKLRPTDDLAKHLVFDPEDRVLHVFRHVGFVKAHLRRSRFENIDIGFPESLEKGTFPPQLMLEVLDSIQYVLFPDDSRSHKSLDRFITKYDFDPKAMYYEGHIRMLPDEFQYYFFAERVAKLMRVVDKGPPASGILAWLERYPSQRNALTIAVLGLFLTAFIGFLSLITGIVAVIYSVKQYNVAVQALQVSPQSSR